MCVLGLCTTAFTCDIAIHMDEHWTNNDLQCRLCNYCGRDFADMITHRYNEMHTKLIYKILDYLLNCKFFIMSDV